MTLSLLSEQMAVGRTLGSFGPIRERFAIEEQNMAIASRIIRDTVEAGLIHLYDKDSAPKFRKYLPFWA